MSAGIKQWLTACGQTYGCDRVYHYRCPDPSTRPEEPYLTYRELRALSDTPAMRGAKSVDIDGRPDNTTRTRTVKDFRVQIQVDLYNSEFGLGWLLKTATAAEKEQSIKNIFYRANLGWEDLISAEDLTTWDDERINYHHRIIVILRTTVVHTQEWTNPTIDAVEYSVEVENE